MKFKVYRTSFQTSLFRTPKLTVPALFVAAVAVVGVTTLIQSHAATVSQPAEAEAGTLAGKAAVQAQTGASNGHAVNFSISNAANQQ